MQSHAQMHIWDIVNELMESWWPVYFTYNIRIIFFYTTLIPIYGYLFRYFLKLSIQILI